MTTKNVFVSGRVPTKLSQALEDYASSTGTSKTAVLISALSSYLGVDLADDQPENVAKSDLILRVDFLNAVMKTWNLEMGSMLSRIESLEKEIAILKASKN